MRGATLAWPRGRPRAHLPYAVVGDGADPSLREGRTRLPREKGRLIVVRLNRSTGLKRGDIIVFRTPPEAAVKCGTVRRSSSG